MATGLVGQGLAIFESLRGGLGQDQASSDERDDASDRPELGRGA